MGASGDLTFDDRVQAQRAIEEVYWRHRIWPQWNAGAKPALDTVLSEEAIRGKVEAYLAGSAALQRMRRRPLTAAELQAEMDRMGRRTRSPGMLREFFAALGNDPYRIAECLARPVLVERLLRNRSGVRHGASSSILSDAVGSDPEAYRLPEVNGTGCTLADFDSWSPTRGPDPPGRSGHTVVWTGSEMIVWGGIEDAILWSDTGSRYDPATDTWTPTSTSGAPQGRAEHTAVWTGTGRAPIATASARTELVRPSPP